MKSFLSRELLIAGLMSVVLSAGGGVLVKGAVFDAERAAFREPGRGERPGYVEDEIIVKFRWDVADTVETGLANGRSAKGLRLSKSLDELNKRYRLKKARRLVKDFKADRGRVRALLKKDKTLLSKKEKRIVNRLKRAPKGARVPELGRIYKLQLELQPGQSLEEAVAAYSSDPDIEYAELNYIVKITAGPNDPLYPIQWPLNNTGQMYPESGRLNPPPGTPDSDIDAPEAWDIYTGSSDVVIAVVDTGIDYTHRDLDDNMWVNQAELGGQAGVDDDGNGYIDDIYGYNFVYGNGDPKDDHGHGTHCAGIIAAEGNNGLDIAGVCWNARIMALKFLNSQGGGNLADAIPAFYYAVENGADVTSNSWGGGLYSQSMREAIDYAHSQGVIMVASAGNDNTNTPAYPAYYEHVISVAATNSNDEKAPFSNYGEWVDIAAPGADILSLRASGTTMSKVYDDYTVIASGTSMSCPHIAGACGLLLSVNPVLTNEDAYEVLMEGVDAIEDGICLADGRINLFEMILAAAPSKGRLNLDRDYYTCSSVISISLGDRDLEGQGSQAVSVTGNGGDSETVVLTEKSPPIGLFAGTIQTASGAANPEDGLVQLSDGEIITATYKDADDGSGEPATTTDTATVDCEGPSVANVEVYAVGPEPVVSFETSEPARARILCGPACGGDYIIEGESPRPATSHAIKLKGVSPKTEYFFVIEASDAAGNTKVNDNNGLCYWFITDDGPRDINVPGEDVNAPVTIQQAIDASWDGGTVWVADGTYTGTGNRNIDFKGKAITVRSENGPEKCIIDCYNTRWVWHRGFDFRNGEDGNSVVMGFTVVNNGYQDETPYAHGGGVRCVGSSPTVSNCIFNGILGNGMANFDGSSPTVSKCTFRGGNRPGMYNEYSSPTVVDCMFVNNLAMENLSGGGMENHYNSNPTVINCTFSGNAAGTYGGGMNNLYSSPTVINCVFSGNHAGLSEPNDDGYGGGMNNLYSSAMVINCTFGGNSSNSSGGGMASFASSTMVSNCIFRGNSDSSGVTESAQIAGSGTVVNYSCIEGLTGALGGTGNIDDNPLLMDVDGLDDIVGTEDDNLRILRGSACVDAGDNTAVPTSVDVDIDRWARFVDDPNTPDTGSGEEAIVDIGAYEYQGRRDLYVDDDAPEDPWPGSAAGSDPLENGTEEHPFDAIQEAIDAAQDGDTIIVAVGTYPEGINFAGKLLTVMSTDPNDAAVVAETIIDGGESSYVVSFGNSEGPGAVLAGFTIIGDGIGIYLHGAFPTIINCTIEMEEGVAMELWHLSEPTLINCTIMGEVNVRPVVRNLRTGQIYDYIQDAIDAATDGDEIVAEEGIYYESIDFKGKEVTVRSSKPDDPNVVAATVISSDGNEIAVTFANGEGPEAILAGFSIIGGPAGIRCEGASPTILHCTIDGIEAGVVLNGGSATILGCAVSSGRTGMRCENTSATITNCEVSGGITGIVFDGGTDTITNCTISSVDVALSCIGTSPTVNGCVIIGGNIGVYCYNAFPVLTNCTIIGYEVAALDLWHMSEPTVTDCNITGAVKSHSTIENLRTGKIYDYIADAVNEASIGDELVAGEGFYEEEGSFASKGVLLRSADPNDPAVVAGTIVMGTLEIEKSFTTGEIVVSGFTFIGGGIRCNRSNPTIKGCTFTGSQIECRGGGSKAYITDCTITDVPVGIKCEEASPTITNCTITDVNTGLYCIMAAPTITNCTIIGSGLFYRNVWYGTVHCYDAYPTFTDCTIVGDPYAVTLHYCSNPTYINCTIEGETQLGTVENLTSGKKYFFFIDNAIRDAESGDEILAGEEIYYENIDFRGKEVKVRSRDPNDPAVVAATVIQGDSNEGVVRFIHEEGPNTLLSGFTITGGRGSDYGSAVVCRRDETRPVIRNCVVSGNAGTGIYIEGSGVWVVNCVISGNGGAGIQALGRRNGTITNCTIAENAGEGIEAQRGKPKIENCIIWDNYGDAISGSPDVTYSDVEGGYDGEGNIDSDPRFVRPGCWVDVNDANIGAEPNDANSMWIQGDYRLMLSSPCIDAASDANVYTDIMGIVRPFDYPDVDNNGELADFDMGAYEAFMPSIEVPMQLTPRKLEASSKGKWVKAHLFLPGGFSAEDVDTEAAARLEPLGLVSEYIKVFANKKDKWVKVEIAFSRANFCAGTDYGPAEVTVVGLLKSGQYFYGTDTIKVTTNKMRYLAGLTYHWLDSDCRAPGWCDGADADRDSAVNFVDFALSDGCCVEVITQQTGRGAKPN